MDSTGLLECWSNLVHVPVSMSQIRTLDPEALRAMGQDINKAVTGPECPENVNRDDEFWSESIKLEFERRKKVSDSDDQVGVLPRRKDIS